MVPVAPTSALDIPNSWLKPFCETIWISSPSRIHETPSPTTTIQWNRAHGNRSSLAGTRLLTVLTALDAVLDMSRRYDRFSARPGEERSVLSQVSASRLLVRDDEPADPVDQQLRAREHDRENRQQAHDRDVPAETAGEPGTDAGDDAAFAGAHESGGR